ncbi:hypothetical protein [Bradyrhizobium sp.]|uniref:hypothetical protein n=1 Tax=Bradyrhizobium sp. TaxID=376 RepID=UPI003D109E88
MMTLPISAVVGVIDSCLARRISVALRPGLTAAAGATIPCVGLIAFAHAAPVPSFLLPFAICGAASAGLCALYADGLGLRRLQPANPVNP